MAISWLSRELGNFSREFFELTMPAIDMFEDEKDLVVKIDLAGFAKKDINLSIKEDILHIRAKREPDERKHTESVYYKHRPHQIDKRIILPISTQEGEKVVGAATYVDGVVTVRIPTAETNTIQIL
ncbi:MAG TPA: archaeal heat shock protein Hsp14 [Nitrososphaeraceae archaeon]|jgi:HSP20 family protein|nr:archaeal heat shock protein Hsp14 [Nitrososphaeraceae archaeon]